MLIAKISLNICAVRGAVLPVSLLTWTWYLQLHLLTYWTYVDWSYWTFF